MDKSQAVGYKVAIDVNEQDIPLYEEALSIADAAIDTGKKNGEWVLTAFFERDVSPEQIQNAFNLAAQMLGQEAQTVSVEDVFAEDWEEKMKYEFPPLQVGSFFIHTFDEIVPEGMVGLHVPAGMAFGTGEHPTTEGCLKLYEDLTKERSFKNGLDMGCGSAILAMASAKKDDVPFLGVDIDEPSIIVAKENVEFNGATEKVTCVAGDGFETPEVAQQGSFDLVFANILANPLIVMSEDLVKSMEEGAVAILSGFLENQKADVYAAYEKCGLTFVSETQNGDWMAAAFKK